MEKMRMESLDMTAQNIEKIGALFPNCITETLDENGKPKKAINFDLLKQMLSGDVIETSEAYEFTWVGKKAAIVEANKPIRKTLRPCKEDSVNWDTTENLYIEGDNLEVLKLLQESYLGAVKMIYIDPPYNTGNDFIYRDDFAVDSGQWAEDSGQYDDEGNRMFKNTDSNGRFHSDWCSMMYSRLLLARNLLADDGVIFISIDDNEVENLKKIGKELFGDDGFIAQLIVVSNPKGRNDGKHFALCHEYLLVFGKTNFIANGLPLTADQKAAFDKSDVDGNAYQLRDLRKRGNGDKRSDRPHMFFPIYYNEEDKICSLEKKDGWVEIIPKLGTGEDGRWRWGKERVANNLGLLEPYYSERSNKWGINYRVYLNPQLNPLDDEDGDEKTSKAKTFWTESEISSDIARRTLKKLLSCSPFEFPKAPALIKKLLQLGTNSNSLILDFFAGSSTTAEAVMQLNAEDGGHRKFILVQLPEETDEESEAFKNGYKNICEIGKERIRRAGRLVSGQLSVDSGQLVVDRGENEGGKDGGSKFQGIADMAKGHGDCEGDLFAGEETSKRRDLRFVRPNEKSGSVESVEHSGGAVQKFSEGVYSVFSDSERVEGGAGNTTSPLQGNRLSNGGRNSTCNESPTRGEQNASCNESETTTSPLTTMQLPTNHRQLDIGFRVFKLADSNMNDVYYSADEYSQDLLPMLESNVKADRTDLDLLFGCLLEWGLPLSLPYTSEAIEGCTVHTYNDGDLIACFDENIPDSVIKTIARRQPLRAVFRDSSFASSPSKINVGEVFKLLAPDTRVKVI